MALHLSPSSGTDQAGYPDHTCISAAWSDPKLLWFINSSLWYLSSWGSEKEGWFLFSRRMFSVLKGVISFPLHPLQSPLWTTPCPRSVSPRMGGGTARYTLGWSTQRLQLSICHSPLAKATVWGSCKSFWEAPVNYPTCTLQPFLVFATGEKSSFGPGRGENKAIKRIAVSLAKR